MGKLTVLLFLIVVSVSNNNLSAQDKFEKESRIKSKYVPQRALLFIDSTNQKSKVKWYKEEGIDKKSIEAKFKRNNVFHSIEFDTLGNIEDVEIDVNWQDLEQKLRDSILSQLKLDCSGHKIVKVQKQLTGSESDLLSYLKSGGNVFRELVIRYELVVRCRHNKQIDLFEYLFDHRGKVVSKSKIVFKPSSHLEY